MVAVILFVPLYFIQHPVDVTVRRGAVATFYCFADGSPKPKLSWRKGDVYLTPGQRFGRIQVLEDGTLEIGNVQVQDEGVYTCIATNNMNHSRMSNTSLTVMYPPVIVNMSTDTIATKDTRLTLQCEVKGNPVPAVTWVIKDDVQSKYTKIMTQDGIHYLNIARVQNSHEGKFICEAKNKLGTARKELFLNVQGRTCRANDEFTCHYHGIDAHCIPKAWVCDMDKDCADNIDEQNCATDVVFHGVRHVMVIMIVEIIQMNIEIHVSC